MTALIDRARRCSRLMGDLAKLLNLCVVLDHHMGDGDHYKAVATLRELKAIALNAQKEAWEALVER